MAEETESNVEWFVVAGNNDSNNRLAEALAAHGYGYDALSVIHDVPCHDGKKRDFMRIPSGFVAKIKRAKRGSDVLEFRFWKRNHALVNAFPADFVEQGHGVRASLKFKSAADKLKAEKAARTAGTT